MIYEKQHCGYNDSVTTLIHICIFNLFRGSVYILYSINPTISAHFPLLVKCVHFVLLLQMLHMWLKSRRAAGSLQLC